MVLIFHIHSTGRKRCCTWRPDHLFWPETACDARSSHLPDVCFLADIVKPRAQQTSNDRTIALLARKHRKMEIMCHGFSPPTSVPFHVMGGMVRAFAIEPSLTAETLFQFFELSGIQIISFKTPTSLCRIAHLSPRGYFFAPSQAFSTPPALPAAPVISVPRFVAASLTICRGSSW